MPRRRRRTRKESNKPDYIIKMHPKGDGGQDFWSPVGAAWMNEDGNLRLQLHRGIVLDWQDFSPDSDSNYILMMFPRDEEK